LFIHHHPGIFIPCGQPVVTRHLTSRQSQRAWLSRSVLLHSSRQPRSWLTCNVGQRNAVASICYRGSRFAGWAAGSTRPSQWLCRHLRRRWRTAHRYDAIEPVFEVRNRGELGAHFWVRPSLRHRALRKERAILPDSIHGDSERARDVC